MPKFYIAYHGGNPPATPEEGAAHMAKYKAWLADLGDKALEPANPLGQSKTVTSDGVTEGAPNAMSGYTVVEAEDIDAALVVAQNCPFLDTGGTLHLGQIMQMPG